MKVSLTAGLTQGSFGTYTIDDFYADADVKPIKCMSVFIHVCIYNQNTASVSPTSEDWGPRRPTCCLRSSWGKPRPPLMGTGTVGQCGSQQKQLSIWPPAIRLGVWVGGTKTTTTSAPPNPESGWVLRVTSGCSPWGEKCSHAAKSWRFCGWYYYTTDVSDRFLCLTWR